MSFVSAVCSVNTIIYLLFAIYLFQFVSIYINVNNTPNEYRNKELFTNTR